MTTYLVQVKSNGEMQTVKTTSNRREAMRLSRDLAASWESGQVVTAKGHECQTWRRVD
jgi:hypothetical protein